MPMPTITPAPETPKALSPQPWSNPLAKIPDLQPLVIQDYFPKDLAKRAADANDTINALNRRRDLIEAEARQAATADLRSADYSQALWGSTAHNRVTLLQDMLAFREDILSGILQDIHHAMTVESDRLFAAADAARAEVRKRLMGIGYQEEPPAGESFKGRIQPGWIESHPLVSAAREAADGLRMTAAANPGFPQNEEAIEALQASLERARAKALAMS